MPSRQTPQSPPMRQVQVQLQQTLQFISSEMEGVSTVVPSPLADNTIHLFHT